MAKGTKRKRAPAKSEDMPEAKKTRRAKSKAAAKVFRDADEAIELTPEQQEARLSRAVFGY